MDLNLHIIKKMFDIRTNKYDNKTYYNVYLLMITVMKNLFDTELLIKKEKQINNKKYFYYTLNDNILKDHKSIANKINKCDVSEFID